ncbi:RTA1 like protein-domain-containing protein [Mrakia frigida]|uniref:RTA1 domain-containing protein n=1 Tax=Mrakia frigida TaxID=29902 RepID=UPI003FCBFA92
MPSPLPSLLVLAAFAPTALALEAPTDFNYLGYIPSVPLAIVAVVVYILLAAGLLWRWFTYRWNLVWVLIGAELVYAVGVVLRVPIKNDPYSLMLFVLSNLLVLLPPCFFLGFDYLVFGRLVRSSGVGSHLLIRENWISRFFVTSDIVTFLLQCGGGGLTAMESMRQVGTVLTLVGIIGQMVSFVAFTVLVLHWGYKLRKNEPQVWSKASGTNVQWKQLYWAIVWTCFGFLIRSVFRSIELAQGYHGSLSLNEGFLYGLDTLPLLIAVVVFIPIYPGMYLGERASRSQLQSVYSEEMEMKA